VIPQPTYEEKGSFDTGNPETTNIHVGNLSPRCTEATLCEVFGGFGPLASIKIMWPRTTEESERGHLNGFVAFMARVDAEAAFAKLSGGSILGWDTKFDCFYSCLRVLSVASQTDMHAG
jgi:U2-associated protein SR140